MSAAPLPRWAVRALALGALLLLASASIALALRHPDDLPWTPQCAWLMLTDLRCPGCGLTRGLYHLLHGEFGQALRLNPLVPFVPLLGAAALAYTGAALVRGRLPRLPELPLPLTRLLGWVFIVLLLYRTAIDLAHKLL